MIIFLLKGIMGETVLREFLLLLDRDFTAEEVCGLDTDDTHQQKYKWFICKVVVVAIAGLGIALALDYFL